MKFAKVIHKNTHTPHGKAFTIPVSLCMNLNMKLSTTNLITWKSTVISQTGPSVESDTV